MRFISPRHRLNLFVGLKLNYDLALVNCKTEENGRTSSMYSIF